MYPQKLLIPIYKNVLKASQGRGAHTLAKLDAFIFRNKREVFIDEAQNISLLLPANPHFLGFVLRSHEQHITNMMRTLLKEGDTVIDVGANIGYFSAWAAVFIGKSGRIFALEPEGDNLNILTENIESLKKKGFDCYGFGLAASNSNGTAVLRLHRHSTYHSIEDEHHVLDKVEATQTIDTIKLSDWAVDNKVEYISLLKIDTEGHEIQVLEGAESLYEARRVSHTILECRSQHIYQYIGIFCKKFNLTLSIWDGHQWHSESLDEVEPKLECLISNKLEYNKLN